MTRLIIVVWLWLGFTATTHAHLLNMTRVQLEIDSGGQARMTLDADLTKALGGGDAYYALSRLTQPDQNAAFSQLLVTLQKSTHLMLDQQPLAWHFEKVEWPDAPRDDFTSGFAWPMTRFYFVAQMPTDFLAKTLTATFTDDFKFEEPIAVNISYANEQATLSRWLVRNQASPAFYFTAQTSDSSITTSDIQLWLSYLQQGMLHIVPFGWDHALFVLGLFLGVVSMRQLALLITAFTLAHTVTLGLATFGAIVVSSNVIEPIIALSIAWIALENLLWQFRFWWRFAVVFSFGLVHGLGFAQALKALGIPSSGYLGALVSFNIGVELAQLAIVLVAFILMKLIKHYSTLTTLVTRGGSVCIALIASFWVVQRLLS